ncbi:hypothetical protein FRX31_009593 [Thalictrum thalictroides]|uniref:Uncharacterized protein n=1 Tax=Thalictrum thalictroides TaxID=46969 RepID=A0A7J6WW78_THATH|nr:hypothetical protein FRX31_009593 [Thalictrum thalictroides]
MFEEEDNDGGFSKKKLSFAEQLAEELLAFDNKNRNKKKRKKPEKNTTFQQQGKIVIMVKKDNNKSEKKDCEDNRVEVIDINSLSDDEQQKGLVLDFETQEDFGLVNGILITLDSSEQKKVIHFNDKGQLIGEDLAYCSSYLNSLTLKHCPISYDLWKDVPCQTMEMMWKLVTQKGGADLCLQQKSVSSKTSVSSSAFDPKYACYEDLGMTATSHFNFPMTAINGRAAAVQIRSQAIAEKTNVALLDVKPQLVQ